MNNELIHSRTKGSKNGIRLYQNKDGTWTELGKERRRKGALSEASAQNRKLLNGLKSQLQDQAKDYRYKYLDGPNALMNRVTDGWTKKQAERAADIRDKYAKIPDVYRSEDYSRLKPMNHESEKMSLDQFQKTERKRYVNDTEVVYHDPKTRAFVAKFLVDQDSTIWNVKVDSNFRGYDLGNQLVQEAIAKYGGTKLKVYLDNEVAIRMYEKNGFEFDKSQFKISGDYVTPEGTMVLKKRNEQ